MTETRAGVAALSMQDSGHPSGHDYELGSPHLSHPTLRNWIVAELRAAILGLTSPGRAVRVLEIGAGHGAFTDHLLAVGAQVTVTEMSRASEALLSARYAQNPMARVLLDPEGDLTQLQGETFDLVVCASVLHHIPDYLAAIASWLPMISPGGSFLSFQDPMWYPRRRRAALAFDRGSYFAWRVAQGDLVTGVRSLARRVSGRMDETNPHDMVEYHVLRQGCDEQAIATLLHPHFRNLDVITYWSTQGRALQALGTRMHARSTFAVRAVGRAAVPDR